MRIDRNQLVRFITAGSVDDGKSTLIGRLLYDSKSIFEDQIDAVEVMSRKKGLNTIDFAMFTDGLSDEREQGITIDVAYRYFTTPKRKFIIADTPGHLQYTRNMVTGASNANVAIILIDARKGVLEQTKRHSYIASLLQISHIIVCVNKMDLVNYNEIVFNRIVKEYEEIASKMMIKDIHYIPISALCGDNVVERSRHMNWYQDSPLLHKLETIHISSDTNKIDARFPIQTVIRPQSNDFHDFRGYSGRIAGGIFKKGDSITVLPSGIKSTIKSIYKSKNLIEEAFVGMSVVFTLEDEIDVGRGTMIVKSNNEPSVTQDITAMICWLDNNKAKPREKYIIKHTTNEQKAIITKVFYRVDIDTFMCNKEDKEIDMNTICKIKLRTTSPIIVDSYSKNKITGSFILIDSNTHKTVAAGMII